MNKAEFMELLDRNLGDIPSYQKQDIMYDYEEHFSIGLESGKTEEEIAGNLGNPINIGRQYRAECMMKNAGNYKPRPNIVRAILVAIGLGFFNLVFVLGPYAGVAGALIGLFAGAIAISVSGAAALLVSVFLPIIANNVPIYLSIPGGIYYTQFAMICISVGLSCLGILSTIGLWKLGIGLFNLTIRYLKFNINIINK